MKTNLRCHKTLEVQFLDNQNTIEQACQKRRHKTVKEKLGAKKASTKRTISMSQRFDFVPSWQPMSHICRRRRFSSVACLLKRWFQPKFDWSIGNKYYKIGSRPSAMPKDSHLRTATTEKLFTVLTLLHCMHIALLQVVVVWKLHQANWSIRSNQLPPHSTPGNFTIAK